MKSVSQQWFTLGKYPRDFESELGSQLLKLTWPEDRIHTSILWNKLRRVRSERTAWEFRHYRRCYYQGTEEVPASLSPFSFFFILWNVSWPALSYVCRSSIGIIRCREISAWLVIDWAIGRLIYLFGRN